MNQHDLEVEIVCALPEHTEQEKLFLKPNSTIRDAFLASSFAEKYAIEHVKLGIFGEEKSLNYVLKSHERVEIYRPLVQDPKLKRALKVDRSNLPRRCR